jgi:hypothetical protein
VLGAQGLDSFVLGGLAFGDAQAVHQPGPGGLLQTRPMEKRQKGKKKKKKSRLRKEQARR